MRNCHHCCKQTCNGPLMIYPPGPSNPSTPVSRHPQPPKPVAQPTAHVLPIAAPKPTPLIEPMPVSRHPQPPEPLIEPTNRKSEAVPEPSVGITDVLSGIYKGAQDLDEGLELTGYLHSTDLGSCEPENMGANGRKSVARCGTHEINIITKDDALQLPHIWSASAASRLAGDRHVRSSWDTKKNTIWRTMLGRKLNRADVSYFIAVSAAEYAKGTENVVFFLTVEGIWRIFIKSSPIELTQSLVDAINTIFNGERKSTERMSEEVNQLFKEFGIRGTIHFLKYSILSENKHSKIAPQSGILTLKKLVAMQASQRHEHPSAQVVHGLEMVNIQSPMWTMHEFIEHVSYLATNLLEVEKFADPQLFNYCPDFVIGKRDSFIVNDPDFGYKTNLEILYDIQQNIRFIYPFFPVEGKTTSEVSRKEAVDAVMQKLPVVHRDGEAGRRVVYEMLRVWVWAVYFGKEQQVNGTHEAGSTLELDPRVQPPFVDISGDILKPGDRYTIFVPAMPAPSTDPGRRSDLSSRPFDHSTLSETFCAW